MALFEEEPEDYLEHFEQSIHAITPPDTGLTDVVLTEGEIDIFAGDEYDLVQEDLSDDDGFGPPRQIQELVDSIWKILDKFGLKGPKLALQSGEESELLTQVLGELGVEVSPVIRSQILPYLYRAVERAQQELPLSKRARGDSAPILWQRAWDAEVGSDQRVGVDEDNQQGEKLPLPVRGFRRGRSSEETGLEPHEVRRQKEEEKMGKMQELLAELWTEAQVPVLDQLKMSSDPRRALLGIMGKTRLPTASKYLRYWTTFRDWLMSEKSYPWPRVASDLIDYMFVLKDQPCRPTVPQAWYQSVCWMFHKAGFEGDEMLADKSSVTENLAQILSDLGRNQSPTLQAARYPIVVLAALEVYTTDREKLPHKRIIAGSLLLRSWGTLRLDDLQHMRRRTLRTMGGLVVTELGWTNTTGPGKRIRQLPVAISEEAQLLPLAWLNEFIGLLQEHLPKDRDYLLDNPTPDCRGTTDTRLTHPQASALSKKVISELRVPILKGGKWIAGEERVVPAELEDLFSQHSGRAVLPSMSIHVEGDKSKRDCLGRWKPSASDDYVRTYRSVVAAIQVKTAKAVQSGQVEVIQEHDIVDRAARHLRERKGLPEEEVGRICKIWTNVLEGFTKYFAEKWQDSVEIDSTPLNLLAEASLAKIRPLSDSSSSRNRVVRKERYMITYSRNRRVARLHSTSKNCFWAGVEIKDVWVGNQIDPTMYNRRCKFCWPELANRKGKLATEAAEESSGTSSEESDDED